MSSAAWIRQDGHMWIPVQVCPRKTRKKIDADSIVSEGMRAIGQALWMVEPEDVIFIYRRRGGKWKFVFERWVPHDLTDDVADIIRIERVM